MAKNAIQYEVTDAGNYVKIRLKKSEAFILWKALTRLKVTSDIGFFGEEEQNMLNYAQKICEKIEQVTKEHKEAKVKDVGESE